MRRFRYPILLGLGWLVWIWAVALISEQVWPWMMGPHNWSYDVSRRATALTRWDSGWYVAIVESGYQNPPTRVAEQTNHAFFPLYPLIVRAIVKATKMETSVAGNIVSALALLGTLPLLAQFTRRNFGEDEVKPALWLFLLFPTSFFFASVYTESLVLFLSLLAVVALQEKKPFVSAAGAYLAGLTRISGILLAPYLFLLSLEESGRDELKKPRTWIKALVAALPPLAGFGTFCLYYWKRFGDPFLFFTAQHNWADAPKTVWDGPRLIWEAVVTDITTGRILTKSPARTLEGFFFVLFIGLSLYLIVKKRFSHGAYSGMTTGIILASGTLESTGRYVLPAFPAFVALSRLHTRPILWALILTGCAAAQVFYVFVFVHWLWAG